jgi:hypothetical protein
MVEEELGLLAKHEPHHEMALPRLLGHLLVISFRLQMAQ